MTHKRYNRRVIRLVFPAIAVLAGCQADVNVLQTWMAGSFSSAEQHRTDPEIYYDIRLHMTPIWPKRDDGPWLYVEQAAADSPARPYRQRVYNLRGNPDGTLESVVYSFPGNPLRVAGAWKEPARLNEMSPDDLVLREGCSIILRKRLDGTFSGKTKGKGCESSLRGAKYATSDVVIGPDRLESWDRGFDAQGRQVWGATKGGYTFVKIVPPS